jgi:SAM-dependent methyltransferase
MAELSQMKQQQRAMWAMGDYPSIAERIATAGATAVEAGVVGQGDVVLDVACGTGNATIPAARTGAKVTGLDLTPELLEEGRRRAADAEVDIEWVEGDAEQLSFDDASFDVVISVFGCMFAPDHRKAAEEIARVLKPGGRMAVCAWTPEGSIGKFFRLTTSHMPPPPEGFQPPVQWGTEEHVRELFVGTGVELEFDRATVEFVDDSVDEFMAEYERDLPPIVAARALLEPEGKWEALRNDILKLYNEENEADDGSYRSHGEYLVSKGRKAD